MISTVEQYIIEHSNFSEEILFLRKIILSTNLEETIKWGMPTYTLNGKNVVGIGAFKAHFGIWFFKGALLKDKSKVLVNAQKGKTSAMRQWRFERNTEIDQNLVELYIKEAIEIEKKGLKVVVKKKSLLIPEELTTVFNDNEKLAELFEAMPLGKKREFADYISNAKRKETKTKRLEKIIPMILNNIGLNDKYKNC
ncbi:YdeI/OmpD-associated family protein [Aureibaculum conchae]|uniref:YdeI/OmpD-associated family protein n=1 Tax=Aureibaculum sp. 2308TA14-22 TaxID=3108392 RepID=UPI00339A65FD